MTTTEAFVAEVARLLREPDERRAQDQLDLFLMGGAPAEPIRMPNPDCDECWGSGWVCSCHAFPWSYSNQRGSGCYPDKKREKCRCWRPLTVDPAATTEAHSAQESADG